MDKWCDFENKWTNHETAECYHRIRYLRGKGMAPQPPQFHPQGQGYAPMRQPNYPTQGMEHAQPVLGHQPSLPRAAVVRYIQPEEEHHDGTMVPVNYYGEEENEQLSQQASSSMYPHKKHKHLFQRGNTKWITILCGLSPMEWPDQQGLKGQDHISQDLL